MGSSISRRDALAGLGAGFVALQIASARAADQPLVRVSIVPIFAVAAHFAAEKQGYFAEQGIAVTTQPVQGGAVGIPGLASGSFDVLYANSISCMTALERGIDLRLIAEGAPIPLQPPDPGALLIRKGEPLHSGKDFEGKIIGVNAKYDIQWLVMQGSFFVISVFLQQVRHYSAIETGLILTPATIGILGSSSLAGRMAKRRPQRTLIAFGFVLTIAGLGLLLAFARVTSPVISFAPDLFLMVSASG